MHIKRGRRKQAEASLSTLIRINDQIRAREVRVIGAEGEQIGVLSVPEAIKKAEEAGLDLIEISGKANPPVAKIGDFGRYVYEQKKKQRDTKAKARATATETKTVQVKIGTGEHDQQLKAKRIAEWLQEGHRVKVDLFLWGRYKYMEPEFLKERLERFLKIIPAEYKIADEIKKSPKGFTTTLERLGKANKDKVKVIEEEKKKDDKNEKNEKSEKNEKNEER